MITVEQLERQNELRAQLLRYQRDHAERNKLIREARNAGISVADIARLAGLTRQHTHKIISEAP